MYNLISSMSLKISIMRWIIKWWIELCTQICGEKRGKKYVTATCSLTFNKKKNCSKVVQNWKNAVDVYAMLFELSAKSPRSDSISIHFMANLAIVDKIIMLKLMNIVPHRLKALSKLDNIMRQKRIAWFLFKFHKNLFKSIKMN